MIIPTSKLIAVSALIIASCLAVCAQTPAPTPKTQDEPEIGAIDGKVVNENGQPLPGAAVLIRAVNSQSGRTTTTDADGNFRVSGLAHALYIISANEPAYSTLPLDPAARTYYRIGDSARVELIRGGAITGTVTNALGEPVIAVRVRAMMIRNASGQGLKSPSFYFLEQPTDDRGIYRIFGLAPGTYLVSAGGPGFSSTFNPFDTDVPTFAPSSTRDNAAEVTVRSGEDSNVDIRYRGEPGRSISGTVKLSGGSGASVRLTPAGSAIVIATSFQPATARGFAFHGLGDGDYDIAAQDATATPIAGIPLLASSETKRITIKGANVTGIELVTRPLAMITGRIALESSKIPECQGKRPPVLAETLVQLKRPEKTDKEEKEDSLTPLLLGATATPDASGAFTLRNLYPGRYQFEPRFYARYWYLQSITTSTTAAKPQKMDAAANWTVVKFGDQLSSLTITLAEGAASIRGRVPVAEGAAVPEGLAVYLMPASPDKAEDVLRFFVTSVAADGTFGFNNLPPGKYLVLTNSDAQNASLAKLRQPESAAARTKLRRTAETKKIEIDLKPCHNLNDYQLK
jgi:hypothetical protein